MTAGEVLARIRQQLGVPWREQTYRDTFKFGGPDTVVTGIATVEQRLLILMDIERLLANPALGLAGALQAAA